MNNNVRFNLQVMMPTVHAAVTAEPAHVQDKLATLICNEMIYTPHMGVAWRNGLAHAMLQGILSPRTEAAFMGMGMVVPANIRAQYEWKFCQ